MNNKFTNLLNEEHNGFATTLEVMLTLVVIVMFLTLNLFILKVMNVQRFMNTVLTTTAAEGSRWGGLETNIYRENSRSEITLLEQANQNLESYFKDDLYEIYQPKLSGTSKINDDRQVTVTINYYIPAPFIDLINWNGDNNNKAVLGNEREMSVTVTSIVEPGILLD